MEIEKNNNKILNSDLSATSFSLNSWSRVRQLAFAGIYWLWDNVSLVLWIDLLVSSYMTLFSIQVFCLCSFFALVSFDYFDLNLCPLFFSGPQRLSIWLLWCDSGVNAELLRGGVRFVLQMFQNYSWESGLRWGFASDPALLYVTILEWLLDSSLV